MLVVPCVVDPVTRMHHSVWVLLPTAEEGASGRIMQAQLFFFPSVHSRSVWIDSGLHLHGSSHASVSL